MINIMVADVLTPQNYINNAVIYSARNVTDIGYRNLKPFSLHECTLCTIMKKIMHFAKFRIVKAVDFVPCYQMFGFVCVGGRH